MNKLPDIKPCTSVAALDRGGWQRWPETFAVSRVAPVVGMSPVFIRKVVGHPGLLTAADVLLLLDQDAFAETFVPRSRVFEYLTRFSGAGEAGDFVDPDVHALLQGSVPGALSRVKLGSVQCVVTSTPYWGLRVYEDSALVEWADSEVCAYGHEQTPEGFIRHTVQVLWELRPLLTADGSVWWNLMDSYNTRTQIRGSALETLLAMQGKDARGWHDYEVRRYSAGHSYLKDGEQCMIPARVAERASRLGYHVKSVVTWAKQNSLPEPQNSRVSRGLEYVMHLAPARAPKFDKSAYRRVPVVLGGRSPDREPEKLTDVWTLPTSVGGGGQGAQFPVALPGRCIALSTDPGDLVLDPFVGNGNAGIAALSLGCRFVGIDVSARYLVSAEVALAAAEQAFFQACAYASQFPEGR